MAGRSSLRLPAAASFVQTARMKRLLATLALLAVTVLPGCGFHLRNALTLPPGLEDIKVSAGDPYSALARSLERSLEHAGVNVISGEDSAGAYAASLDIQSERWAATPLAVDQFGRAQEFALRYAVVFRLRSADGDVMVPQQAVELSRDYVSTPDDATGVDSERELLTIEMQREMTASILRRIDAAVRGVPH